MTPHARILRLASELSTSGPFPWDTICRILTFRQDHAALRVAMILWAAEAELEELSHAA